MFNKILCLFCLLVCSCAFNVKSLNQSVAKIQLRSGETKIGSGTAFSIAPNYLISAAHLCSRAKQSHLSMKLEVLSKGTIQELWATIQIVDFDEKSDVCLLHIDKQVLKPLPIAKHNPEPLDQVLIFGAPLGVHGMLTKGYIAFFDPKEKMFMLSCPAFGGNSGSPVLNADGEIIGVLVQGAPIYPQLSIATSYKNILNILAKNKIKI